MGNIMNLSGVPDVPESLVLWPIIHHCGSSPVVRPSHVSKLSQLHRRLRSFPAQTAGPTDRCAHSGGTATVKGRAHGWQTIGKGQSLLDPNCSIHKVNHPNRAWKLGTNQHVGGRMYPMYIRQERYALPELLKNKLAWKCLKCVGCALSRKNSTLSCLMLSQVASTRIPSVGRSEAGSATRKLWMAPENPLKTSYRFYQL